MRKIFQFKEAIAIIISLTSSFVFINPDKFKINLNGQQLVIYPALFNIIVLFVGILSFSIFNNDYYLIKRRHGKYDASGWEDLNKISKILNIPIDRAQYFTERTSSIVGQLVKNFSLFLWPLIIFYAINIIKDYMGLKIHDGFNNCNSYSEFSENYSYTENYNALWFLILSGLANIFNFISGIGLWISFSTLYQKTLDADNKSTLYMETYQLLLSLYIISYVVLLGTNINILSIKETILTLDMLCSIFNCVAMILFFNRLVQILFFFQSRLKEKLLDKFYFFIATILFPTYACFQIFFGVFDQLLPENFLSYQYVKGIVFFVCFIGKYFLILFLYSFIRIKWLHAAIITLLAEEGTPIRLADEVGAISNSIDSFNNDIKNLSQNELD